MPIGDWIVEIKGDKEVAMALSRMADMVGPTLAKEMMKSAQEAANVMKDNVPVKTGSLKRSISYDIKGRGDEVSAEIGPSDSKWGRPVGRAVELGRTPGGGFPNWLDIQARYGVSTAVAFRIAKSIWGKGSKGLHFVQKSLSNIESVFERRGIRATMEIVQQWK